MDDIYLVWSNEHKAWWGPAYHGYVEGLRKAGRYTRSQALAICRDAIPTAMHVGIISEIPVRLVDVVDFLRGQICAEKEILGPERE